MANPNAKATRLRMLHKPGEPVVFTNVYDAATASIAAKHPATKAIATASFAFAACAGVEDNDLTFEQNLAGVRRVASVVNPTALPLTVDLQDGYSDVAASIKAVIEAGASGCNIEDVDNAANKLRSIDDAVARIKLAVAAAAEVGVPDFCVNARTDVLVFGGTIDEAVERGKAYLAAGALTVFVWGGGGGRGVKTEEVKKLVAELGGMVNVKMNLRPGFLNAKEIAELGVARISVGPELFHRAMKGYREGVEEMLR